jgi:hypothetical protein
MNKFLLIFLCLGVFPTIGLAQSKEDFYKSLDVSVKQTETYIEKNLMVGEFYANVCNSLVGLAEKYHLNDRWCLFSGNLHRLNKESCEKFRSDGAHYMKHNAKCLLKLAQNLESEVEAKRESVIRDFCGAEDGQSRYKEYDDIKDYYRSLGEPKIICADSREDDRCLLVQPVESIADLVEGGREKGVYYSCNIPKLEFSETVGIRVKRDANTCGLAWVMSHPTGVLSKDGTEYSLDDFDTNCILKSWENKNN